MDEFLREISRLAIPVFFLLSFYAFRAYKTGQWREWLPKKRDANESITEEDFFD